MKFLKKLNPIVVGIVALVIGVVIGSQIPPNCPIKKCPPPFKWGSSGPIAVEWKTYENGAVTDNVFAIKEGMDNLYLKNGQIHRLGQNIPAFKSIDDKYTITLG